MKFLDEDLGQVEATFAQYKTADKSELEAQYSAAIEQARTRFSIRGSAQGQRA